MVKQVLRDPDEQSLAKMPFDIDLSKVEKPWVQLPGEPEESYGILTILINDVPKKSLSALFNHLEATGQNKHAWHTFRAIASKFSWVERAWAYEKNLGVIVMNKKQDDIELLETEYKKFALAIVTQHNEMLAVKDPITVSMDFGGLNNSLKLGAATQLAKVYESLVGSKTKLSIEGKFDHRVAVAVAEFARDT